MKHFIYLIRNSINGKGYVGKTSSTVAIRFAQHIEKSKRQSKSAIHCAIRKYGVEAFTIEELAVTHDPEILCNLEREFIRHHQTYTDGYNCTLGGDGMSGYKRIHSQETKEKISRSLVGRPGIVLSSEHKAKLIASNKSRILSVETRLKMSQASKGRTHSQESNDRRRSALIGKKRSPETIEKIRQAHLGKKHSEETKRKLSLMNMGIGRPHSEETKAKLSLIVTRWHSKRKAAL